jgi:hypothetical protein
MNYAQLNKYASQCEIEVDRTAYILLKEREQNTRFWCLQDYCSFNVRGFRETGWYKEFVDFVISHGSELRRQFTHEEFLHHAQRYRIIRLRFEPQSFAELKKIKIKKHNPVP